MLQAELEAALKEEAEDIDYKDLWPDYYPEEDDDPQWADYEDYDDDYDYEAENNNEPEVRINYKYYGKVIDDGSDDGAPVLERKEPPTDIRCGIVNGLREKCLQNNLLEIWRYREDLINTTTTQEILDAINRLGTNPWTSYGQDFSSMLGGIQRNSTGHIIGASATTMFMSISIPDNAELVNNQGSGVELELADANTLDWEEQMIRLVLNTSYPDMEVFVNAAKSFGDVSANAIFFDAIKMAAGYLLMFTYTIFMLGKLNTLEVKMYLAVAGIISVGMGLLIAVGLSSALGYPYTPMHAALPFLCLGTHLSISYINKSIVRILIER